MDQFLENYKLPKFTQTKIGGTVEYLSQQMPQGLIQDYCLLPACSFSSLRISSHLHSSSYHESLVLILGPFFHWSTFFAINLQFHPVPFPDYSLLRGELMQFLGTLDRLGFAEKFEESN